MASRLTSFVSERPAAVVWSAVAALFSVGLWWQWRSFEARQETFLDFYSRTARAFPAGEFDRLVPSSDFLVMWAVLTGVMVSFAVVQWRLPARRS
jgi:hypothetical protein